MHYVTGVEYECDYKLQLCFEDGSVKSVDLAAHLEGEVFEPLKDLRVFRSAQLNPDIDTVVWDNGADMSPDFLYEIGEVLTPGPARQVAETSGEYRCQ